jgi:predicted PurR-regulated permease PerM
MIRIAIAVALTLLLGPGAGHLYLKRFKRAVLLILSTVFFAVLLAFFVATGIPQAQLTAVNASLVFQNYSLDHPSTLFYFDAIFAALWAYALVDAFMQAKADLPSTPPDAE